MFKVNNKDTRKMSLMSFFIDNFLVNYEHISHLFLTFLLLDFERLLFTLLLKQSTSLIVDSKKPFNSFITEVLS